MSYQEDFINKIAPIMQQMAVKYGHKIVSAAIGQACLESGYGTTFKATNHKNYFGLKYRQGRLTCNNGYFKDGSTEQLKDGTSYNITDLWYHFDTDTAACEGYYQFINIPNYANVKTASTPLQYITNIKNDGYATDISYIQKVSNIIAKYNLTKFDTLKLDPVEKPSRAEVNIIKQCSTANTTVLQNRKIDWIVVHYTAGQNSKVGTARSVASYFAKTSTKASADFIVDNDEIVQYNPDLTNRYTWAVGGSKYTSMSTSQGGKYYGICTNKNSISVELCSMKVSNKTLNATDQDWYFTEATVNRGIELVQYLMEKYNIKIDHVIMHHHVTGKICPNPWCVNEARLAEWNQFLQRCGGAAIRSESSTSTTQSSTPSTAIGNSCNFQVQVLISDLEIRKSPNGAKIGKRTGKGTFTIVQESNGWGLLKSKAGWIYINNPAYVKKVTTTVPVAAATTYQIKVTKKINIYANASTQGIKGTCNPGVYTITETQNGFGKLKSGIGWVKLDSNGLNKI